MSQSAGLHAVPTAILRAADAVKAEVKERLGALLAA
jgi:hypothetical protein